MDSEVQIYGGSFNKTWEDHAGRDVRYWANKGYWIANKGTNATGSNLCEKECEKGIPDLVTDHLSSTATLLFRPKYKCELNPVICVCILLVKLS